MPLEAACPTLSITPKSPEPVGLLAGSGRFPVLFADKARLLGIPIVCVGIRHHADPCLQRYCWRFYWAGVTRLGRIVRCFRREGVTKIVMAGKIAKTVMFTPWRVLTLLPDWRGVRFWLRRRRRDNRDDSLLLDVIEEFASEGMVFASALEVCPELLASPGLLSLRAPTASQWEDIRFGWTMAKELGRLDIGQSVVVKERAVLAVEAIEGTDRCILRAGELCPAGGFSLIKVSKPHQDMRFDVPTIGPQTVRSMHHAGGRVIAIEAYKTIIVDQAETIQLANQWNISIVSLIRPETLNDKTGYLFDLRS
ncbi:MAG: DUF1009 domain-containing protein [Gemmataceae bacterium]